MSLLSAHGVPMLTDHGYHPMLASWTLGVLGGSSAAFVVNSALLLAAAVLSITIDERRLVPQLVPVAGGR
jgi:hypothetical protein